MPVALEPTAARRPRSRLLEWGRGLIMERLTPHGRAFCVIGLVVTALSSVTLAVRFYFLFCALAGVALTSLPLARLARVRLRVRYDLPSKATCGVVLPVSLEVANPGRRAALDLTFGLDGLPPQVVAEPLVLGRLGPGEERSETFSLTLKRRGYYRIDGVRQETCYPFGVWRDLVRHGPARTLLVYPRFSPLVSLDVPVGLKYQPGGIALSSNLGESTEFLGVREFRPGDAIRNIHWKSWGRVGKPVVKEFQEEYFCKIALVLDTFLPAGSGERFRPDFEACLSLAAAVADKLSHTEFVVDLFAAGPDLYTLQAGRNLAHLDNVLDVLACLEPSYDAPFETVAPVLVELLSTITTVIFILLDWDSAREAMVRIVRDHGPAAKVILVRGATPTLSPAGAESLAGRVPVLTPADVAQGVDDL